jgi:hypothetical protein
VPNEDDKLKFMDIIAEYDQYAGDVDLSFKPAEIGVGEYTVVLKKYSARGVTSADGIERAIGTAVFEIAVGQREGDSLRDEFWFTRGEGKANMDQRRLLLLARCLSGTTVRTIAEAIPMVEAAAEEGTAMLISIESSKSRKTGKTWYSINYKSTVAAESVPSA